MNLKHFAERMSQTENIKGFTLTLEDLRQRLIEKFTGIDYKAVKADVEPFIKDKNELSLWSKEFFISITKERLK